MTDEPIDLRQLASRLGIDSIPASWNVRWPEYLSWKSGGGCPELRWELPSSAAEVFDLPGESLPDLRSMYNSICGSIELNELADFWHYLIYHMPESMERNTNAWGLPDGLGGVSTRLFSLAAMVSGCDHAVSNFEKTGLPSEVALASLGYIGRYARDIKEKRGVWGLESIGWLSNYVRAKVFRLGRLSFKAGESALPFRAFKNRRSGELVTFCEDGGRYREDGCADGTNGIFDPHAWTSALEIANGKVVGNPISNECTALQEPMALRCDEWDQLLAQDDPIVEIHIAGGSKLIPEECAGSFQRALEFFPLYYPPTSFRALTCSSWLLDPALPRLLPQGSNIAKFARRFHTVPVLGSDAQAYDLVFGSSDADPTKIAAGTSLQRAIAGYVASGMRMRSASGFILWDEKSALG